jgi:ElaB/YqjD/DUF883 family membrane-anchored ribosome-binding protein
MPPRNPELPEGTDQIVNGATAEEGGGKSVGFVASGGTARAAGDKLVSQVRDQVETLRGQAGEKLRTYADDGKGKATGLLDDFAGVIDDAAKSIDERLGAEYGDYAHRASEAVATFAGRVREKSVDDLVDDTREIVRKSPAVAIAAAAVVGFALMRLVRTGLDDFGAGRTKTGARKRPARKSGTQTSDEA